MTLTSPPRPPRPPQRPDPVERPDPDALIEEARRRTRRRRRGYAAAALAAAAGLLGFYGFNHGGDATLAQDGGGPASGQATNVFAQVRGWIVYTDEMAMEGAPGFITCADDPRCADEYGIWAVDPTRPAGHASDRVQLRDTIAVPLDWSDDGTKLLILEPKGPQWRHVVLNADGTETVLRTRMQPPIVTASLSPDGSQMVYASLGPWADESGSGGAGIYVIETDGGGRPHLLRKGGRRQWYAGDRDEWIRTSLENPTFSPDGTKIAYIDGMHDWGNGLRVMDADGSHVRVLLESNGELAVGVDCAGALAWSPDGSRLAFCGPGGIWVIGVDGSGLRKVIPNGENPNWSPDGSRIAYQVRGRISFSLGPLRIADADGGNVQKFTWGNSGPWNPLEPASD